MKNNDCTLSMTCGELVAYLGFTQLLSFLFRYTFRVTHTYRRRRAERTSSNDLAPARSSWYRARPPRRLRRPSRAVPPTYSRNQTAGSSNPNRRRSTARGRRGTCTRNSWGFDAEHPDHDPTHPRCLVRRTLALLPPPFERIAVSFVCIPELTLYS